MQSPPLPRSHLTRPWVGVPPSPPPPCTPAGVRPRGGTAPLPAPPPRRPLPAPPRAVGPVWAALPALEPSAGKPRRTGRRSSFYRPSNWGWSRRGNTKILCTQLLSVRGRRPGSRSGEGHVCAAQGSTPRAWLRFKQAALVCCLNQVAGVWARGGGGGEHKGGSRSRGSTNHALCRPSSPHPLPSLHPARPAARCGPARPLRSVTVGVCGWSATPEAFCERG